MDTLVAPQDATRTQESSMPQKTLQQLLETEDSNEEEEAASFFNIRERISQTIAPRELTDKSAGYITENYVVPFLKGETPSGNVLNKENLPEHYGEGNVDPQVDMFRKYLGLDQHFGTMVESPHSENAYTFSDAYKRKIIKDLKDSYGGFEGYIEAHNLKRDTLQNVFDHKTVSYQEAQRTGKPYTGRATTLYPLGRYKEVLKEDEDKNERYVSFRDRFDLNPSVLEQVGLGDLLNRFNNPYDIRGRIYESSFSQDSLSRWMERAGEDEARAYNFDTTSNVIESRNR